MELHNGSYQIGGVEALQICRDFDTPVYVYDTEVIGRRYRELTQAFQGIRLDVKYACKASTNPALLKYVRSLGAGVEGVSIQEIRLALLAGFDPQRILYTPNCVDFAELREAVDLGVHINIDNISLLEQFGHFYGSSVPVCIRINPHIMAGGNANIAVGHIDSKFGISIHQMRHVQRIVDSHKIMVHGLHMHTGSDILDAAVFAQAAEVMFSYARNFSDLRYLDFGSGFKVAYRDGDVTTDVVALGETIVPLFNSFCREYGRELELWFEPGKYLLSEAGYFLVRTNVVKQTTATVFAGVNSGMNHLIRPMFYDSYHRILNLSNPGGTPRIYTVVGYICETDTFGWDRQLNEVREGDILAFCNAGAYGMAMASNYNSRYRPAEVLVHDAAAHLIRRRENFEDLTRTANLELDF